MLTNEMAKEVFDFYGIEENKNSNVPVVKIDGEYVELTEDLLEQIIFPFVAYDADNLMNSVESNIKEHVDYSIESLNSERYASKLFPLPLVA